jgi:hypothetical protein
MLLAHAERLAASMGYREVKLYTNKLFVENVKLYQRSGLPDRPEGGVQRRLEGAYE